MQVNLTADLKADFKDEIVGLLMDTHLLLGWEDGQCNVWRIHQVIPALSSGRSQSALIREAIDAFLHQQQPQGRLARLRQGRGLWADRTDLPDWSALRSEMDRAPADLSP